MRCSGEQPNGRASFEETRDCSTGCLGSDAVKRGEKFVDDDNERSRVRIDPAACYGARERESGLFRVRKKFGPAQPE